MGFFNLYPRLNTRHGVVCRANREDIYICQTGSDSLCACAPTVKEVEERAALQMAMTSAIRGTIEGGAAQGG